MPTSTAASITSAGIHPPTSGRNWPCSSLTAAAGSSSVSASIWAWVIVGLSCRTDAWMTNVLSSPLPKTSGIDPKADPLFDTAS
jgi:hypothetical protein